MNLAEANNIIFEIMCEDIDLSFISDFDFTTIMGNLLDNAFDECIGSNMESKKINFRIGQINCFVVMMISNTCEKAPKKKGDHYISQKKGHVGLGLLNVKEAVGHYNATMNQTYEDGVFTVQIIFPGQAIDI